MKVDRQCAEELPTIQFARCAAHHVQFNDGFWWPRLEVNRMTTIPYSFQIVRRDGSRREFQGRGRHLGQEVDGTLRVQ